MKDAHVYRICESCKPRQHVTRKTLQVVEAVMKANKSHIVTGKANFGGPHTGTMNIALIAYFNLVQRNLDISAVSSSIPMQTIDNSRTIDGALQESVPALLRASILYLFHYLTLPGHQNERQIYDTMKQSFNWPEIDSDEYVTAKDCLSCSQKGFEVT